MRIMRSYRSESYINIITKKIINFSGVTFCDHKMHHSARNSQLEDERNLEKKLNAKISQLERDKEILMYKIKGFEESTAENDKDFEKLEEDLARIKGEKRICDKKMNKANQRIDDLVKAVYDQDIKLTELEKEKKEDKRKIKELLQEIKEFEKILAGKNIEVTPNVLVTATTTTTTTTPSAKDQSDTINVVEPEEGLDGET
jgi:chromosome segregation ATPase